MNPDIDFNKKILAGLVTLEAALDSNQRVAEIVNEIVSHTNQQFEQVDVLIKENKFTEASAIVHKVKARYGYIGLDDIFTELTKWEEALATSSLSHNHSAYQIYFKDINEKMINVLKNTDYLKPRETNNKPTLPLTGKLVLVAEDDEVNSMVFESLIKELGADVLLVHDGNEAVMLTQANAPDMIFMDVHMPYFSGTEAIKLLRSKGINCPIVSISASTRLNEKEESLAAGSSEFMIKPANRTALHQVLLKYLS
jgi:CheY-like chemotaxis protein